MSSNFKDLIKKHNLQDVRDNILSFRCVAPLRDKYVVKLDVEDSYGYICLVVNGENSNVTIKYGEVVLLADVAEGRYQLPIKFVHEQEFIITGTASSVVIGVKGAKIVNGKSCVWLSSNDSLVEYGYWVSQYSCSSAEELVGGSLSLISQDNDLLFVGQYWQDNVVTIDKVFSDSQGVYYCNNIDNYTSISKIADHVDDIIIMHLDGYTVAIYIVAGDVIIDVLDVAFNKISSNVIKGLNASSLIQSQNDSVNCRLFGIKAGNKCLLYYLDSIERIDKISETKADNMRIFEYADRCTSAYMYEYAVDIVDFVIEDTGRFCGVMKSIESTRLNNVIDYMEIGDEKVVVTVGGNFSIVNR